jgi:hypothetical protein
VRDLRGRRLAPEEALHAACEIGQPERLLEIVAGALAKRLDSRLHRGVTGHEDDRRARVARAGPLQDLQTADAGHHHVGHDHVELLLLDPGQGLLAAAGDGHAVALSLEKQAQGVLRRGLVVHHEN